MKNMDLSDFLEILAGCSGDEAMEIIGEFQCGGLTIEHMAAEDFE